MLRVRTLRLERDGAGPRELVLLAAALVVLASVSAVVLLRGDQGIPAGRIGYHAGDIERWVNARGETVGAPRAWPPETLAQSPVAEPGSGLLSFPTRDGRATAYVSIAGEGSRSFWRLMVEEGGRVTDLGGLADVDGPPLVAGNGKSSARSVDGVPLLIRWSPDGSRLAWGSVSGSPYNLHIADRGSWSSRSYPLEGGYVGELAWSADARYLAVSTYGRDRLDHTLLLFDALENHGPQRLAKGCVVVWAPDSRHLVLHGEPRTQPGLLVISVSGDVRRVTERTDVAPFAWVAE